MYIKSIKLHNFRNYKKLSVSFSKKINIIYGRNAQGKTNLLESIYVLGFTKSHRSFIDNSLITTNEKNDKKDKNNKAEINKFDIDINEMINVLEKAKELLPGDDKRLEEMTRLIEIRKEEIAAKAAMTANKGKNKKK